jgi:uroporphyrinogen-III synthase
MAPTAASKKSLKGRVLVLTRPRRDTTAISRKLRALGARVFVHPAVELLPCASDLALRKAAQNLQSGRYVLAVFTSRNAVRFFAEAMGPAKAHSFLRRVEAAAVGPATARELRRLGVRATLTPEKFSAKGLAAAFVGRGGLRGKRVLFPCARQAREALPAALEGLGARVERLVLYETVSAPMPLRPAPWGKADAVLLMSPSAVGGLRRQYGKNFPWRPEICALCIGTTTAQAARRVFWNVHAAREHSLKGLMEVLLRCLGR